ncbi:hypothetical protein Tco_0260938 [Tanacetum coccineum]
MTDHSQKWHDDTTSRNIGSSSSKDGLAALVNKLDNLGRDMKKLKESVHAIQVGCQICKGPHLDKDCPLNEIDNHPPYGEKRQRLEELLAKHQEESARRSTEMEVWIKKLQENAEINTRNQSASLKNLETQDNLGSTNSMEYPSYQILKVMLLKFYNTNCHVGHTDISEPVKKALLKLWLIDCFKDNSAFENNPTHRSFDDYKWEFNLEIDKLADEYELGIGKKGHILDHIWEYCNQVHNKNYELHNYEFENEECEEIGIEDKDYHPSEVQVETFEVKKYSFKGGQSFICVTKDLDNTLPLGRKNGSKFKEMIRMEVANNKT